jgi:hypothetical protein
VMWGSAYLCVPPLDSAAQRPAHRAATHVAVRSRRWAGVASPPRPRCRARAPDRTRGSPARSARAAPRARQRPRVSRVRCHAHVGRAYAGAPAARRP